MDWQAEVLRRFGGGGGEPFFLPDLTLWYRWHRGRGRLPRGLEGATLPAVCRALDFPAWVAHAPWRTELPGINVQTVEEAGERTVRYETPTGTLTARWTLEAAGDWWQTEYPVKSAADLPAAHALVATRRYVPDSAAVTQLLDEVAGNGVLAFELPMRPYQDILHTLLGWETGLTLWAREGSEVLSEMLTVLEEQLAALVEQIAALPGSVVLAPDNLDGQFVSPRAFRQYLAPSYARSAAVLHAAGKRLVVHAGGPVRWLLPLLAEAGVDAVEGVAAPPQSDASLAEARAAAGPDLVLWGGISQDYLTPDIHDEDAFRTAVLTAAAEAREGSRMLLGIADRVPVELDLDRLQAVSRLAAGA